MLDISFLYAGVETGSMPHRYGRKLAENSAVPGAQRYAPAASAAQRRPVVVWNMTRACNLRCIHCYADAVPIRDADELNGGESRRFMDDLARFGVPALLFSGGEPLLRPDFFELADHARSLGLRVVLSTNGTLLTDDNVANLRKLCFSYVGISLDGMKETHDHFRGVPGSFERTLEGFRRCREAGLKVGLRLTLTRHTVAELPQIFDLIERENVPRVCFYHLAPAGRGWNLARLENESSRQAMDFILTKTAEFADQKIRREILTVDNHCDGPYLYGKLVAQGAPRAAEVEQLLRWNGGGLYSSGVGIAAVDCRGDVHADQFWTNYAFGNVRRRPFSEIWTDCTNPLMAGLKNRKPLLKGRCGGCRWLDHCGGALRSRAAIMTGDPWAADPACYLTDDETTRGFDA
jgi:radical SAM protein with 4Fe4S-binding SPASM domain